MAGYTLLMNDIVEYYGSYDERSRLARHSLELLRSREILSRYLPKPPARILDIGGATGSYSFWLAELGYEVSLVDLTPRHIEQAREADATAKAKLSSIEVGDALGLTFPDEAFDLVLLMGPIYHLQERADRVRALREAARVAKPGSVIAVAAISRFAATLDGFKYDLALDPAYRKIADRSLATGNHVNDSGNSGYFTTARFHRAAELRAEIEEAGLRAEKVLPVEGFAHMILDVEEKLEDEAYRGYLLGLLRDTEEEESLIGISSHLLAIARRPA